MTVRIAFIIIVLSDLEVKEANIMNAYFDSLHWEDMDYIGVKNLVMIPAREAWLLGLCMVWRVSGLIFGIILLIT